jgi:ABC-type transporter Mla subunit MlaD
MQRKRNITVGIFVIVAVLSLIWLIFKFGDLPLAISEMNSYEIKVQLPVAKNIQKNTSVQFAGYQVGKVTKVVPPKIMKDLETGKSYHHTVAVCSINNQFSKIPTEVEAKLMTRGLGSSYISLELPKGYDVNSINGNYLTEGIRLQGSTGVSSEFFPEETQNELEGLVKGMRELIANTNEIIGDPNTKTNIKTTLSNMSQATAKATEALEEFRKLSKAGSKTLQNTDKKMQQLTGAMLTMNENLSDTLSQIRVILAKIDNGEGTASRFLNDGRLYESMLESSRQLEMLMEDMRNFINKSKQKGLPIKLK